MDLPRIAWHPDNSRQASSEAGQPFLLAVFAGRLAKTGDLADGKGDMVLEKKKERKAGCSSR